MVHPQLRGGPDPESRGTRSGKQRCLGPVQEEEEEEEEEGHRECVCGGTAEEIPRVCVCACVCVCE